MTLASTHRMIGSSLCECHAERPRQLVKDSSNADGATRGVCGRAMGGTGPWVSRGEGRGGPSTAVVVVVVMVVVMVMVVRVGLVGVCFERRVV